MSAKTTLGIFISGFVVYGVVSALAGKPYPARRGPAPSVLAALVDPVAVASADSGSRLKAEFLLGEDGSKDYQLTFAPWIFNPPLNTNFYDHPVGLYWDSQRSEECAFQPAADGVMRCLPTNTGQMNSQLGYIDAACTQLAVYIPAAEPGCQINVPKYGYTLDTPTGQTCQAPSGFYPAHLYPIGTFIGPNQPCYNLQGGVCSSGSCPFIGSGGQQGYATYAMSTEVPAASFVAATPSHDP